MRCGLIAALIILPMLAAANPFDGVYRQVANADCGLVGVDGGALRIADNIFYGVDMECRMTHPVNVVDMDATLFTMQCSGEADIWTERAMIMDAKDTNGIIMVWNGYAFKYERCPE